MSAIWEWLIGPESDCLRVVSAAVAIGVWVWATTHGRDARATDRPGGMRDADDDRDGDGGGDRGGQAG